MLRSHVASSLPYSGPGLVSQTTVAKDLLTNRSPTLSYTQRLEQRIEQLQAALLEAQKGSVNPAVNETPEDAGLASDSQPSPSPPRAVEALRIEADGRLSYHGSTSLFQLPDSTHLHAINKSHAAHETASDREILKNSAWRERAYERLADIPV